MLRHGFSRGISVEAKSELSRHPTSAWCHRQYRHASGDATVDGRNPANNGICYSVIIGLLRGGGPRGGVYLIFPNVP